MRVLFITGEYPTMQGGVGDYTRRLSQALTRLGVDVHVLTHADAGEDHLRSPADPYEPTVYPLLRSTAWGLWAQVNRLARQIEPEVVHIQYQTAAFGLHPAANYLPLRLSFGRKTDGRRPRVYTTFHDLRPPYIFPKAGFLRQRAVLDMARRSDGALVTNPADWSSLAHADARLAGRLHAIPIGSNIHCEPPAGFDRTRQRAEWGVGRNDWLLAYFGFLNKQKGGETLVHALDALVRAGRPARLIMVGGQVGSSDPTNELYLARVRSLIDERGLAGRVSWTGFISPDQVSADLLAADCAVLPYLEGASLRHGSLMAALAHGMPIVTTRSPHPAECPAGLFPELTDGESARLVAQEQPEQLAAAVTEVMTDAMLKKRLAEGAGALSQKFDWLTIAQRHVELYSGRKTKTT